MKYAYHIKSQLGAEVSQQDLDAVSFAVSQNSKARITRALIGYRAEYEVKALTDLFYYFKSWHLTELGAEIKIEELARMMNERLLWTPPS